MHLLPKPCDSSLEPESHSHQTCVLLVVMSHSVWKDSVIRWSGWYLAPLQAPLHFLPPPQHTPTPYTCMLTAHPCRPLSLVCASSYTDLHNFSHICLLTSAQVFPLPRMLLSFRPPLVRKPRTNYHSFRSHSQKTLFLPLLLGHMILRSTSNYWPQSLMPTLSCSPKFLVAWDYPYVVLYSIMCCSEAPAQGWLNRNWWWIRPWAHLPSPDLSGGASPPWSQGQWGARELLWPPRDLTSWSNWGSNDRRTCTLLTTKMKNWLRLNLNPQMILSASEMHTIQ